MRLFKPGLEGYRAEPMQVKLIEHIADYWEMQQNSQAYEKKDASTIEFLVDLTAQEKKSVTYRVKRLNLEPRRG